MAHTATSRMAPIPGNAVTIGGILGQRIEMTAHANLLALDWEQDFYTPFREPTGEPDYVGMGKTLEGIVRLAQHTNEDALLTLRARTIEALLAAQGSDGYLGVLPPESRTVMLWDVHEQAYVLLALVVDYEHFGDERVLAAATRLASYLLSKLTDDILPRVGKEESWGSVNTHLALLGLDRALLALHRVTGEQAYLDFCLNQLDLVNWDPPIVEGRFEPFDGHMYAYLTRCLAQLELYEMTGDAKLLRATHRALDYLGKQRALVITGTNSIGECWHSDQTGSGDLGETCATAYLIRMLSKLLCMEGDGTYGDWMERSIYNALLGAQSPDGRQLRYYTPFEGARKYWDKDTYCCPGNYRRLIGELPELIAYRHSNSVTINLYAESSVTTPLADGIEVVLRQHTDYPNSGNVSIEVTPEQPTEFTLRLRLPGWCDSPELRVNGDSVSIDPSAHFAAITRQWCAGDRVELTLPMPWRLVRGYRKQEGKAAIMRGPVVFGLAPSRHPELEGIDPATLAIDPASISEPIPATSVRKEGLACPIRLTDPASGQPFSVTLTEFPDPAIEATYFMCPANAETTEDELTVAPL